MLKLVHDATVEVTDDPESLSVDLDELCRLAAQDILRVALLAERRAYLALMPSSSTKRAGGWWEVGNGFARRRRVVTGAGAVQVASSASSG